MTASEKPRLIDVATRLDARGALGVIEAVPDAGFVFKRLYFLYAPTEGSVRGLHAHKALRQCMIAVHGSFRIVLKGKGEAHEFVLSTPQQALLIPEGYWRELNDFSHDAVCLVAASEEHDEHDYIRDHNDFLAWEAAR